MSQILKARPASVMEASYNAQMIAFAPLVFQAAKCMRDLGILDFMSTKGKAGATLEEMASALNLTAYAITVLLEIGEKTGLTENRDGTFFLLPTGRMIQSDQMTRINMDFTHDVCYQGLFYLEEALKTGTASGLKVFGEWDTIYQALSSLPEKAQKSWFAFDHFYSDGAFPDALPLVFADKPTRLMDVGGNTGKWAVKCCTYDLAVNITILDLPGQLGLAKQHIAQAGVAERVTLCPMNLLDHSVPFPKGCDVIWMSQFLVCFSEDHVIALLKRAADALHEGAVLFILDTFCDRQMNEVGEFCLEASSLYFTCMANGNSRMYTFKSMREFIRKAGLQILDQHDNLGGSHTLIRCALA
ncbi:MAG: SAM-dependent methyltransferase [Spartobacteria bacterium]|nr:SAM-dependent methyltransferase [Spartobacteria bacterium]